MTAPTPKPQRAGLVAHTPEEVAARAARVLERMSQTPHGPKRKLLAAQHVDLSNQVHFLRGYQAAQHEAADTIEKLTEALRTCDAAINEMFRYYDGGETRGSYDGKPERAQLRKAGYAARAALSSLGGDGR